MATIEDLRGKIEVLTKEIHQRMKTAASEKADPELRQMRKKLKRMQRRKRALAVRKAMIEAKAVKKQKGEKKEKSAPSPSPAS